MTLIWFTPQQINQMVSYAVEAAPHEACGIVVGKGIQTIEVIPIKNVADDPTTRYRMDQHEVARILPDIEKHGLNLLAFYHSHPNGDPIPSQTDIREAVYDDVIQIIIGLKTSPPRLSAWRIQQGMVTSAHIQIADSEADIDDVHLSNAQKVAFIVGVFITIIILVVISLSLLPPAPPIPG